MRRRMFVAFVGSAITQLLAWPRIAAAQTPPRVPRVGYITGGSPATGMHILGAFRQGLKEQGYVEGQTIILEMRWTDGLNERIAEVVAELVRLNVDVLVASNGATALAAKNATNTIPIVMFAGDPVGLGLVVSLAQPGGNLTGLSFLNTEITGKRLELIADLVPGLARAAVLRNPAIPIHAAFWQETRVAARKLGVELQSLEVHGPEDIEAAFTAATQGNAQALLVFDDPLTIANRRKIVALAAGRRLPAIYGFREFPDDGGLISYGPNFIDLFRRAAAFVGRILKGAKPADLPVEQPTTFELVINLQAAKSLGLTVPPRLLARADEVIE